MLKGSFQANLREGFGELGCGPVQLLSTFRPHTMRFGSTAKVLLKCKLKYYRISECVHAHIVHLRTAAARSTMRFGSTAKVLLKCKLKYYRISECPTSDCLIFLW